MVRQGDFIVELVEANTKTPFKEHSHDGKTFVEVEPGQEYFIAVQKPGLKSYSGMLLAVYFVDGQALGHQSYFHAWQKYDNFHYNGCWEKTANSLLTATKTALKFVTPEIRKDATSAGADEAAVGKIEVKVFQGINLRCHSPEDEEDKPVNISSEVSGKVDESA